MRRLLENRITLNKEKCSSGLKNVIFLGHLLIKDGIGPDPSKTEALMKLNEPKDYLEVRLFLGMINQLMKFFFF